MASRAMEIQSRLVAATDARQRGRLHDERRLLEEVIGLEPNDPRFLNALGVNKLAMGDAEGARLLFERAVEFDSAQPAIWMNIANAVRVLGESGAEGQALDRVLELDRFHFMALLRKAELEQRSGRKREAILGWNAVIQVASTFADRPPVVKEAIERGQDYLKGQSIELAGHLNDEFGETRAKDPDLRRFNACMDLLLGRRSIYR